MSIEPIQSQGKIKLYKDATLKDSPYLTGIPGNTILDTGYIFAPYIPIQAVSIIDLKRTKQEIKEATRLPIKVIKVALKRLGYKFNKDFTVETNNYSNSIIVTSKAGKRFTSRGTCQVHCIKGKMNIFWTYDPGNGGKAHKEVDISLADPDCFKKVADTILQAFKECKVIRSWSSVNQNYYSTIKI